MYRPFLKPLQGVHFKSLVAEFFFSAFSPQNGRSSAAALQPTNVFILLYISLSTSQSQSLHHGIFELLANPPILFNASETHAKCHKGRARNQGIFTFLELISDRKAKLT